MFGDKRYTEHSAIRGLPKSVIMWHLDRHAETNVQPPRGRMLIKEAGASPLIPTCDPGFDETVALAQSREQPLGEVIARAVSRLRTLERAGRVVSLVRYHVGQQIDDASAPARRTLIRELGAHARKAAISCEIRFEAPNPTSATRDALLALADELALPAHRQLELRFCFESQRGPLASAVARCVSNPRRTARSSSSVAETSGRR